MTAEVYAHVMSRLDAIVQAPDTRAAAEAEAPLLQALYPDVAAQNPTAYGLVMRTYRSWGVEIGIRLRNALATGRLTVVGGTKGPATTARAISEWAKRERATSGDAGWDIQSITEQEKRLTKVALWLEKHPWSKITDAPQSLQNAFRQAVKAGFVSTMWDELGEPQHALLQEAESPDLYTEEQIAAAERQKAPAEM